MRTLVISDLHLGALHGRPALDSADPRDRLARAIADADRLVLLGDLVELRELPLRDALRRAMPGLTAIGSALGSGTEVVVVPGNHDHQLGAAWAARRAGASLPAPLGLESELDWLGGEPLARVAEALASGGARVRACYPGIWLRADVYATHGHYLDRHTTVPILERLAAGVNARFLRQPVAEVRRAEDYEAILAPSYAWIDAVAQARVPPPDLDLLAAALDGDVELAPRERRPPGSPASSRSPDASIRLWEALGQGARGGGVRRRLAIAAADGAIAILNRVGLGPLRGDLSGPELRRASLRAFGEVLRALSVDAAFAIFGHSHRAGPLPRDDRSEWRAPSGASILNSGCWVTEPGLLGATPDQSPYRAGFGIWIDGDSPPELVDLLAPVTTAGRAAIGDR